MISINDLRVANAKMIALDYEREINYNLRQHITNDSNIINVLNNRIRLADTQHKEQIKKVKQERNAACGVSVVSIILLIISLL